MNTMRDIMNRMREVNGDLDVDTIYNRIARLYAVGYNGRVVVTKGSYIGKREVVVSGYCSDVIRKLEEYPTLASEHIDPNGMTINNNYGTPAAEFFATLYHGEK